MVKILDILKEFLGYVEQDNPFNLVLKGGTALSLYFFNHRDSEDLDFDAAQNLINKHKEIEKYFVKILENLRQKQTIRGYKINRSGFASTNRYHINLELKTHKTFRTKIDIDFVKLPKKLIKRNNLCLYPIERFFISKALTFNNRGEFKDLYDLSFLIKKVDVSVFEKKQEVILLIQKLVQAIHEKDAKELYKAGFRNADLRFKSLKESGLDSFIQNTTRRLNILSNKLRK